MRFGCQSMVGRIERVLLKHPREAYVNDETLRAQWQGLNYLACPDYDKAVTEFEGFVDLLKRFIPEIHYLPKDPRVTVDSIYAHDSVIITARGAILCNMTREQRRYEPAAMKDFMPQLEIPVLGAISDQGRLECGDVVWLDERTLAVGRGRRTNNEGIRQLRHLVKDFVDELIVVDLPSSVFHLMGIISLIDEKLAVINSMMLPEPFRRWLVHKGFELLDVPPEECDTLACNVLALAPRQCILLSGNRQTQDILTNKGIEVLTYSGEEISLKGSGGPTCLTRPLLRV
jgi:N-dimethylarginine dimethylaminohydrolase